MQEMVLILDCGSQYTQLIARRVRELNVYCEIHPYNKLPELENDIKGLIISGSPYSVNDGQAPEIELDQFKQKMPVLGVCYGAQYLAKKFGGRVEPSETREYVELISVK
jgi:GMP synthase (glutamine-hydrolysing)